MVYVCEYKWIKNEVRIKEKVMIDEFAYSLFIICL